MFLVCESCYDLKTVYKNRHVLRTEQAYLLKLTTYSKMIIKQSFNYKVKRCMSSRLFNYLPTSFPVLHSN